MTILGKVIGGPSPASIDLRGTELVLDADGDTSITSDSDDRIDVKIAGADDFKFTANNLNVLSGSTLTIDSGATIVNSGTATNFGTSEAAVNGILVADAAIIDLVIFGPALDPIDWSHKTPAVTASLMAASLHDAGSDSTVKIWDLTSTTLTSQTPISTLTISGAATPYCIGAWMGWVAVGHEDGITIYSPHNAINGSGATGGWLEHTAGHPKSLNVSQAGAEVRGSISLGPSDQPLHDPRTGGPVPCVGYTYAYGSWKAAIINDRGVRYEDTTASTTSDTGTAIVNGRFYYSSGTGSSAQVIGTPPINQIAADNWTEYKTFNANSTYGYFLGNDNSFDMTSQLSVAGDAGGLSFGKFPAIPENNNDVGTNVASAWITRTYNSGYNFGDTRLTLLANSKTADRNVQGHTLTENGTVTEAAANSGEIKQYSGFSSSNYLSVASHEDWDEIGTGDCMMMCWAKKISNDEGMICGFGNSGNTIRFHIMLLDLGSSRYTFQGIDDGATTNSNVNGPDFGFTDGGWHHCAWVRVSSTERHLYINGNRVGSSTTDTGSLTSDGNLPFHIGVQQDGSTNPIGTTAVSMVKFSTLEGTSGLEATDQMIKFIYEQERPMFDSGAKCLLQSGSTDAVLDTYIDKATGKVAVTQTDSQMIWNGLVVESTPTVNTGNSEHNQMFADTRVEVNSSNIYATVGAKDIRNDLELVRGLATNAAQQDIGIDFSKAKVWINAECDGTPSIRGSFGVKSITDTDTGKLTVTYGVPFKNDKYSVVQTSDSGYPTIGEVEVDDVQLKTRNASGTLVDPAEITAVWFGESEND